MPRIGLLSDSHGRADITRNAVRELRNHQADILIHLGDIGSESVIDALAEPMPVHLVFGNTDWEIDGLTRYAESLGISVNHPVGRLDIEGGTLVFQHGDRTAQMQAALAESVRYLCHGHTHVTRDDRVGGTRVINPGALHRAARYTVALLDTEEDKLTIYPVGR